MSQSGSLLASTGSIPGSVAEMFVTNSGTAIPSGNSINFFGTTVAAGSIPFQSISSTPTTVLYEIQRSQAIASTDAAKVGLTAFNSLQFTVDSNAFTSLSSLVPFPHTSPTIDFKSVGLTTVFTTASSGNFYPVIVYTVCDTAVSVNGDGFYSVGWIGPDYNQIVNGTGVALDTAGTYNVNSFNNPSPVISSSSSIIVNVSSADTGTALTGRVIILGFYL